VRAPVHRRGLVYLAAAGPGLIAAAAGNDAGGVVTYSSAGSDFIYRTLFLMVLITIAYVVVQEMVARLAVHTGKGLAALIREEFPLRMTAFAVTAFAVANIGLMVTEFGGIATAFDLFGVSRYLSVPIAAVAIWSLVLFGSYRYAERVFLLLTIVFIAYPIAAILGHPNWHQVASNTLWPHFIASKSFLLLAVALIGTTITPYIQLYEAGAVVDKGVKPADYKFQRVDAIVGAILAAFVAMSIIVATGATIGGWPGGRRGAPVDLLCRGRGDRGGAVGVLELPPGPPLPGPVHCADPGRGGGRPGAGQPDHPHFEHPGPRGRDHPHDSGADSGAGQPPLAPRDGGQRPVGPLVGWHLHPVRRRRRLGFRGADDSRVVWPRVTDPGARISRSFAPEPGVRGGYAAMVGSVGTFCA
jgi:hypothetical protein